MQSAKETASNIAATAKAGMEKTKATLQEKGEKITTRDPLQKEMATQSKEERIKEAELRKQEAKEHNAAVKQSGTAGSHTGQFTAAGTGTTGTFSTTGEPGDRTGHQMSAMPGHGTGQPMGGHVTEGVVGAHPAVGTGRTSGHDPRVGPNAPGYGTGGSYT